MANMKLLLITSVICFAAALAAPTDKQKREILPGDPRYGTDYHHHHHHHHENENEVEISKAAGGYVGSFSGDAKAHSSQLTTAYGPPNFTPGKPLGPDHTSSDSSSIQNLVPQVPATSYGIPDIQINTNIAESNKATSDTVIQTDLSEYQVPAVEALITSYGTKTEEQVHPQTSYETSINTNTQAQAETHVQKSVPEIHQEVIQQIAQPVSVPEVISVSQEKATTAQVPIKTQEIEHSFPSYTSSFSSFPNFYFSYPSQNNVPVKTVDNHVYVKVPQPYPVPVTKHVTYPVPVPHPVEVPKPYYVRVAQPVPVTVNRPYAVEVPRAVPYPVPHYVRTSVPVVPHQHVDTVDLKAGTPFGFIENAQSTFQDAIGNLQFQLPDFPFQFPDFSNFSNVEFPFPSFIPQVTPSPIPAQINNIATANSADSITIDNPILKAETTDTKTVVAQPAVSEHARSHQTTHSAFNPAASATHITAKQEHVKSNGHANGGYSY